MHVAGSADLIRYEIKHSAAISSIFPAIACTFYFHHQQQHLLSYLLLPQWWGSSLPFSSNTMISNHC